MTYSEHELEFTFAKNERSDIIYGKISDVLATGFAFFKLKTMRQESLQL